MTCLSPVDFCLTRGADWSKTMTVMARSDIRTTHNVEIDIRDAPVHGAAVIQEVTFAWLNAAEMADGTWQVDGAFGLTAAQTALLPDQSLYYRADLVKNDGTTRERLFAGEIEAHE